MTFKDMANSEPQKKSRPAEASVQKSAKTDTETAKEQKKFPCKNSLPT
ncbi:MAG: hypothetical protein E6713_14210 [Sporomusaceae bacterium]|nr:hypothetical protein [Sporomusaceae bacterium]